MKRYIGIDWGEKRIGLATADDETMLALPLKTVTNLTELLGAIIEEEADEIVIGSPRKMSGEEANNPAWENFVAQLRERCSKPLHLLDERLTSQAADSLPGEDNEKASRDEVAATLILQDYLDRLA